MRIGASDMNHAAIRQLAGKYINEPVERPVIQRVQYLIDDHPLRRHVGRRARGQEHVVRRPELAVSKRDPVDLYDLLPTDHRMSYDVRAVLVGKSQSVTVAAGKYTTAKIEIHVLDNGTEMKDAHFLLYLADGAERLPVLLEAVLPVATARVELVKAR